MVVDGGTLGAAAEHAHGASDGRKPSNPLCGILFHNSDTDSIIIPYTGVDTGTVFLTIMICSYTSGINLLRTCNTIPTIYYITIV